jgi:hypothetical protein
MSLILGRNNHPMARIVQTNSPEIFTRVWNKKSCPKVFLPAQGPAVRTNNIATERNDWIDLDSNPSKIQRRRSRSSSRSRSRESDNREYRKSRSRCIDDCSGVRKSGQRISRSIKSNKYERRNPPSNYIEDFSDNRLSTNRDYVKRNRRKMSPAIMNQNKLVMDSYSSDSDAKPFDEWEEKSMLKRSHPKRNKRRDFFDHSNKPQYFWDSSGFEDWEDTLTLLTQAAIGLCLCFGLTFCLS